MYKTYEEITGQYESLVKTHKYFEKMRDTLDKYLEGIRHKSITILGSGSSYAVSKSMEISFKMDSGGEVNSFTAGDIMLNFPYYKNIIKNSLLIAPSRSGSTSEVVEVFRKSKGLAAGTISICAREKSPLSELVDFNLELPWAFDKSVCQTRTITNLYASGLFLLAVYSGNQTLWDETVNAIEKGKQLISYVQPVVEEFVKTSEWDRVVVLADSQLSGIGEEAALAFKEICRIHSNYYHILDVRHGPMVLVDNMTLVVMACSPFETRLQHSLITDLKNRGAKVITVSPGKHDWKSDMDIHTASFKNYAVTGIQFILISQLLAYYKAVQKGVNPDSPDGLEPWIKLNTFDY